MLFRSQICHYSSTAGFVRRCCPSNFYLGSQLSMRCAQAVRAVGCASQSLVSGSPRHGRPIRLHGKTPSSSRMQDICLVRGPGICQSHTNPPPPAAARVMYGKADESQCNQQLGMSPYLIPIENLDDIPAYHLYMSASTSAMASPPGSSTPKSSAHGLSI